MKSNIYKDIFKFIIVFVLFLVVTIPAYLYFTPSKTQDLIDRSSNEVINKRCSDSPKSRTYQECYRSQIVKMIQESRPIDYISIADFIDTLYKKDLVVATTKAEQSIVNLHYMEMWSIYIDYLMYVSINRNDVTFLDIFLLAPMKKLVFKRAIQVKSDVRDLDLRDLPPNLHHRRDLVFKKFDI